MRLDDDLDKIATLIKKSRAPVCHLFAADIIERVLAFEDFDIIELNDGYIYYICEMIDMKREWVLKRGKSENIHLVDRIYSFHINARNRGYC